jgi:hypothetical protein
MKKNSNNSTLPSGPKGHNKKNMLLEFFFPTTEELDQREDEEYNYYWLVGDIFNDLEEYQGECKPVG